MVNKLLTIITLAKNSETTIDRCLKSVKEVVCDNNKTQLEHIVIYGHSNDQTLSICHDFNVNILVETGKGIFSAMNQGLLAASGKYIMFLNSDDRLLYDPISIIKKHYPSKFIFCSVEMYKNNLLLNKWKMKRHPNLWRMPFPHPGFISCTRELRLIGFDETYLLSADYDQVLKVLNFKNFVVDNTPITAFYLGGASSNSRAINENILIRKSNHLNYLSRVTGFFYDVYRQHIKC